MDSLRVGTLDPCVERSIVAGQTCFRVGAADSKENPMIRVLFLLAALVAAALFAACGDDDDGSAATTVPATVSAAATTAAASETDEATPTEAAGPVELTSTRFEPQVTVKAEGWEITEDVRNSFTLEHDGADGYSAIYFLQVDEVTNPETLEAEEAPADLAAWLRAHPSLSVTGDEEVTIGGLSAVQLDVTTSTADGIDLFPQPQGIIGFYPEDEGRIIVVDGDDGQFVIFVSTNETANFDTFLQIAAPVLATVEFS
jgi:hypothetical protein